MWLLHCGLCIAMKPCCYLSFSCLFMVFTLGLLPYPRHCFEYWLWEVANLGQEWPYFGLLLLKAWASLCPYIFTLIYAVAICARRDEIAKGFAEAMPSADPLGSALLGEEPTHGRRAQQFGRRLSGMAIGEGESKGCHTWCKMLIMMPEPTKFPCDVKEALSHFDSDAYAHDFGTSSSTYEDTPPRFKAEKIAIVLATLSFQVNLVIFQLGLLLSIRYIFCFIHQIGEAEAGANQQTMMASDESGMYQMLKTTLLERSFASYAGTLEGKLYHGLNSTGVYVNSTEVYVNMFWGML